MPGPSCVYKPRVLSFIVFADRPFFSERFTSKPLHCINPTPTLLPKYPAPAKATLDLLPLPTSGCAIQGPPSVNVDTVGLGCLEQLYCFTAHFQDVGRFTLRLLAVCRDHYIDPSDWHAVILRQRLQQRRLTHTVLHPCPLHCLNSRLRMGDSNSPTTRFDPPLRTVCCIRRLVLRRSVNRRSLLPERNRQGKLLQLLHEQFHFHQSRTFRPAWLSKWIAPQHQ